MSQETSITRVPFHGDEIICFEAPQGHFVAVKPICERLGLAFPPQWKKLNNNPQRWGVTLMVTPSAGGAQETVCIPVTKLFGWLATITVSRVKPEVREALIAYQNEADEVLDRHFRLREAEKDVQIAELERQLWHCSEHLRMALPKWQKAYALQKMGQSDYMIAQSCNWSMGRWREVKAMMRQCGINPKWREDMATLPEQVSRLRWDLQKAQDTRQQGLFDA